VTGRVAATSNNQTQLFTVSSYKWQKLFERHTQLRLFPKQIVCQSYFTLQIIFTNWKRFVNSFKCVSDGNVWHPGQRVEIHERIASESLLKVRTTLYEAARHLGRVKTVVTNIGVRGGGSGGMPPPGLENFQGQLYFQGKRKLLKIPEW